MLNSIVLFFNLGLMLPSLGILELNPKLSTDSGMTSVNLALILRYRVRSPSSPGQSPRSWCRSRAIVKPSPVFQSFVIPAGPLMFDIKRQIWLLVLLVSLLHICPSRVRFRSSGLLVELKRKKHLFFVFAKSFWCQLLLRSSNFFWSLHAV